MVPLVPTFPPMVTLAPMVPLAAEKRSGFSCYQRNHWPPMVPLVKFPMVPLGESRTHALSGLGSFLNNEIIQCRANLSPALYYMYIRSCTIYDIRIGNTKYDNKTQQNKTEYDLHQNHKF